MSAIADGWYICYANGWRSRYLTRPFISVCQRVMSLCTLAFIFSGIALATPIPNARMLVARQFTSTDLYKDWPTYDELPLHPSFPTKAAWGVWVRN